MEISVNSDYFRRCRNGAVRSAEECALLCKAGGFSVLDCTPGLLAQEDWESRTQHLSEFLKAEGLRVEQSHAPFNRYSQEPAEAFREKLRRAFRTAAILGARRIVIHADEYHAPEGEYDSEAACRFAYDFFAPFVEMAKKDGLGVAVENLFEDGLTGAGRSRCTSTVEEVLRVVELFHDEAVSVCWDFGHAAVSYGEGMLAPLRQAAPLVTCTHVHDNYLQQDMHLPLFHGKIDWEAQVRCLREAGYAGAFTFEYVYGTLPDAAAVDFLQYQRRAAAELLREAGFPVNGGEA